MVPSWAHDLTPSLAGACVVPLGAGVSVALESFCGDDAGMVTAVVPNAAALPAEALRASVTEAFGLVLKGLRDGGFPHPVRVWAFVPAIHERLTDDMDRYRVFNLGRYDAFTRWLGGPAAFALALPAASALGHGGDSLVLSMLGLRTPGVPVENPRQTPASAYSLAHGPRPPCFARAMLVRLPEGTRLLVSGTASIRGEDSVHPGSLHEQVTETFTNLERLVGAVPGNDRFVLRGIDTARVYFSRPADLAALMDDVSPRLPPAAAVEYVWARICRAELLVEIEATLAPMRA